MNKNLFLCIRFKREINIINTFKIRKLCQKSNQK